MLKGSDALQGCRQDGAVEADRRAMMQETRGFDVRRFTREEHERGDTAGWRLEVGWFTRSGGLVWAWFRREVEDGQTREES
jgi:hypothetical protein